MKKIKEIHIQNFKAFPDEQIFRLEGKNLLLFGENGAGKSSLYWALYTFLQSSEKDDVGVDKYFENYDPTNEDTFQSLLNIHSLHGAAQSFIKLKFDDDSEIELSKNNGANTRVADVKNTNLASDFITYKLLYNFYGSTHKTHLNVWQVFKKDILPFFMYGGSDYSSHYSKLRNNRPKDPRTGYYYKRNSPEYSAYQSKIDQFNIELERLLGDITQQANIVLKDYLDIHNLEVILTYSKKFKWDVNKSRSYTEPQIKYHIKIKRNNVFVEQHRPQSFLNEAVLAQLSIAVRLGALFTRLGQSDTKILVLDDLLISLDMDNREKVLEILLQKTTKSGHSNRFDEFQLLFFTHDRGLNYFVGEKIKQHGRQDDWIESEIYASENEIDSVGRVIRDYPKPILIDGYLDELGKAKSYLNTKKDYTAAALYVRKALERTISERLPQELVYTIKGEQRGLAMLWEEFLKCYTVPQDKIDLLSQSRSMILNPQAHYNFMSLPVYYSELNRAIELVDFIQNNITCSKPIVLLSKGMVLTFTHPSENYSFTLELLGDFLLGQLGDSSKLIYPRCKILSWQYINTEFWDFIKGATLNQQEIDRIKNRKDHLNDIFSNLKKIGQLSIDSDMIKKYTKIDNGLWILEEVLDKARVSI